MKSNLGWVKFLVTVDVITGFIAYITIFYQDVYGSVAKLYSVPIFGVSLIVLILFLIRYYKQPKQITATETIPKAQLFFSSVLHLVGSISLGLLTINFLFISLVGMTYIPLGILGVFLNKSADQLKKNQKKGLIILSIIFVITLFLTIFDLEPAPAFGMRLGLTTIEAVCLAYFFSVRKRLV